MLQNFSLPMVPSPGQLTVNLLQSLSQVVCFIEHSLHTKPEEGFTLDPPGIY